MGRGTRIDWTVDGGLAPPRVEYPFVTIGESDLEDGGYGSEFRCVLTTVGEACLQLKWQRIAESGRGDGGCSGLVIVVVPLDEVVEPAFWNGW